MEEALKGLLLNRSFFILAKLAFNKSGIYIIIILVEKKSYNKIKK